MSKPFFSIVIPTKNRSFLVGYAIQSALRQSFSDLEVIVADDSDDAGETRNVVMSFQDPRIRYFRSGGLTLPDNSEFGIGKAAGEYINILQDKMVLKKHALQAVFNLVERERHPAVTWGMPDILFEFAPIPLMDRRIASGKVSVKSSEEILRIFLSGRRQEWFNVLPTSTQSCTHAETIQRIRKGPMGRYCCAVAPDITPGFQILAFADHVVVIDEPLGVLGGTKLSTGALLARKSDLSSYIARFGGKWEIHYDHVPVKAALDTNLAYNDYSRIRSRVGGRLAQFPLDLPNYFAACWLDIHTLRHYWKADTTAEEKAWREALAAHGDQVKHQVYARLAETRWPRLARRLHLQKPWKVLRQFPKRLVFDNTLEYVIYEETPHLGGFLVPELLYWLGVRKLLAVPGAAGAGGNQSTPQVRA